MCEASVRNGLNAVTCIAIAERAATGLGFDLDVNRS